MRKIRKFGVATMAAALMLSSTAAWAEESTEEVVTEEAVVETQTIEAVEVENEEAEFDYVGDWKLLGATLDGEVISVPRNSTTDLYIFPEGSVYASEMFTSYTENEDGLELEIPADYEEEDIEITSFTITARTLTQEDYDIFEYEEKESSYRYNRTIDVEPDKSPVLELHIQYEETDATNPLNTVVTEHELVWVYARATFQSDFWETYIYGRDWELNGVSFKVDDEGNIDYNDGASIGRLRVYNNTEDPKNGTFYISWEDVSGYYYYYINFNEDYVIELTQYDDPSYVAQLTLAEGARSIAEKFTETEEEAEVETEAVEEEETETAAE